jgi:hypothetical protein
MMPYGVLADDEDNIFRTLRKWMIGVYFFRFLEGGQMIRSKNSPAKNHWGAKSRRI